MYSIPASKIENLKKAELATKHNPPKRFTQGLWVFIVETIPITADALESLDKREAFLFSL